ncbi:uncharacterized protein [Henckelia pumila]|uniref:uncharacterized protein n=1 Tax=Henckelia pumila TaxID=405737 RepID=UPI003C6DEAF8
MRLFPNILTGTSFTWYTQLPCNSIFNWHEFEKLFNTQFYRTEPETSIADFSRLTQKSSETTWFFIERFKKLKSHCKVFLPEPEFVKLAQRGLDFELRKKFQGTEFRDFNEIAAKVVEYEDLLQEESRRKKTTVGYYYQDAEDVALAVVSKSGSFVCPLLKRKAGEPVKSGSSLIQGQNTMKYTFYVSKTEEIFEFLVK